MPQLTLDQALELAETRKNEGNLDQAAEVLRQIIASFPRHAMAITRLGIIQGMSNRISEARDTFLRAHQVDPQYFPAILNLSLAYERLDDLPNAIAARHGALQLRPDDPECWHRLGVCLGKSGQITESVQALQKSIDINPIGQGVRNDLCVAMCKAGMLEAALESARQGAALQPDDAEALRVVGFTLKVCGKFDEATETWRKLVESDPSSPEPHGQWAMCLLADGDFERGWREYEWRWNCDSFSANKRMPIERQWGVPHTVGSPDFAGRSVLLYTEQGVGDTIQFIRYASLLADRGARVLVSCQWPVKTLVQTSPGVRLAYGPTEQLPKYDWHIPMLSLPLVFGTTLQTIPANVPYVKPPADRSRTWKSLIDSAAGSNLRVGIAWAGNPIHKNDSNRSMDAKYFSPLATVPGVTFFSLQKSLETPTPLPPPPGMQLVDLTSRLCDFADTAAMIANLDLVICVDTAVAHLAGALAKPVWNLLSLVPDFRWLLNRPDTPWYPTMKLFRQKVFGQWEPVIEDVVNELKNFPR